MKNIIEFICPKRYEDIIPEPVSCYKEFPEWFAKTDKSHSSKCPFSFLYSNKLVKDTTIKKCPGVTDFLKTGYVIKNWTNILVRSEPPSGSLYFDWEHSYDGLVDYGFHPPDEYAGMSLNELPNYGGFHKISSPWFIKTSPGISCYYTHPVWTRDKRFTTVSSIVHTDISPIAVKWFFEWNFNLERTMNLGEIDNDIQFIRKNTPLIMIFPFVRNTFKMNVNYIESEKYESEKEMSLLKTHDWFGNSIYNNFRKKQGIDFL